LVVAGGWLKVTHEELGFRVYPHGPRFRYLVHSKKRRKYLETTTPGKQIKSGICRQTDRQREDRSRSIHSSSSSSSKVVAALDFFHYHHDNEGIMDH